LVGILNYLSIAEAYKDLGAQTKLPNMVSSSIQNNGPTWVRVRPKLTMKLKDALPDPKPFMSAVPDENMVQPLALKR